MDNESRFFDKITIIISVVCIVIISVTGVLFLKMENATKSTIIKSKESVLIEEQINSSSPDYLIYSEEYDYSIHGLININTAGKKELMLLDNIGEERAEAIIEYRSLHPFNSTSEIRKIDGIGEKTYNKIKDKICVE